MTAPEVPTVTTLEVLPIYNQSENRPKPNATLAADLLAMQNSQAYYLAGTRTTLGNAITFQGATGADRSATGTDAPKLDALQRRGRSRASRA